MNKLIREPLVHFILLGAALFAFNAFWQARVTKADRTIVVTTETVERLATVFAGEQRRAPSDDDIQALIISYVEEEALSREAQRLGLGDDDTIIRRRLAQKMRFMTEDVDRPDLPKEAVLKDWFEARKDEFARPEERSFQHIYFSPDQREDSVEADALSVLETLDQDSDWKARGDPFMMQRAYINLTLSEVKRLFGGDFAAGLFAAEGEGWTGPVESAFGLHLIRITSRTPAVISSFEDVQSDVETAWLEEAQRSQNLERRREIVRRYKVETP